MNIHAIFQVRIGSHRLPKKMFKKILGKHLLWHVVERVRRARRVDQIILATTRKKEDDHIVKFALKMNLPYYRGSDTDVLDRFYKTAKKFDSDVIVRITPDDPFKDPRIIDNLIQFFLKKQEETQRRRLDYISNTITPTYPEGLDVEIFTFAALEKAWQQAKKPSEREHVTPYIWKNPKKFKIKNVPYKRNLSSLRWTIDYPKDLEFTRGIYKRLYHKKNIFLMEDILKLLEKEPALAEVNRGIISREGYIKSIQKDNQKKLWQLETKN